MRMSGALGIPSPSWSATTPNVTVQVLGQVMQRGTQVLGECQVWEARREQVPPAALPHTKP